MNASHVLLDLDGTLTDPAVGITRSIAHALAGLGRAVPAYAELRRFIGPPLAESFHVLLDTTDESLVGEAIALYRARFAAIGLYENEVCAGIPEVLRALRERGLRLWVATSKPVIYSIEIVRHFGLAEFFQGVHGSELDGTRTHKRDLIAHLLDVEKIPPRRATMVGDRSHDVVGARANGVAAIGVLWGYGTREELAAAGAGAIVEQPADLVPTLLGASFGRNEL